MSITDNILDESLVLLSKRPANRDAYHSLFRQQLIHKIYHAVAPFELV
jgi:hypothetical protein